MDFHFEAFPEFFRLCFFITTRKGVLVFLRFFFTGSTIRSDTVLT